MKVVVVTGMSGAGKSSVLNFFEDLGYFCMDNLPPQLMGSFLQLASTSSNPISEVALGVDIRGRDFFDQLFEMIDQLKARKMEVSVVFVEAEEKVLIRRYKEKRRPHPLDRAGNIYDGIQREKALLHTIRGRADHIIDTSNLNLAQLKERLDAIYSPTADSRIVISLVSFGYKYGILLDADLVVDARFLANPFYVEDLKKKTGLDLPVQDYVMEAPEAEIFLKKMEDFLSFLLPLYFREGKRTLVIGIGCTGGKHRSVVLTEYLARILREKGMEVNINHRDSAYWE